MLQIKTLKDLVSFLRKSNYVDIYIFPNKIIAKDFGNTKKVAIIPNSNITIEDIYKLVNILNKQANINLKVPTYAEYFSVYLLTKEGSLKGFRGTYGECIEGKYINLRGLSTPKQLEYLIRDPFLKKFFAESFKYNNSVIVSGATGSGKTTLLISFFNFINQYTPEEYKKILMQDYLLNTFGLNVDDKEVEKVFASLSPQEQRDFYKMLKNGDYYNMLKHIHTTNKKVIYTIEHPIEYYYKNKNILFLQHDIETHAHLNTIDTWIKKYPFKKETILNIFKITDKILTQKIEVVKGNKIKEFQNLIDKALRTNPEILYIGEIKNPLEFDAFLRATSFGIPTYTTSHADDCFSMIQRIYDTSSFSSLEKLNVIARGIYGIVNTNIYYFHSLGTTINFFDVLFLNDTVIRSKLYNFLKEGNLHKFAEDYQTNGIRQTEEGTKVYYVDKLSSLLYALYNLIEENKTKLQDPIINSSFKEECKFLLNKYNFTEKDFVKFKQYYIAERYLTYQQVNLLIPYILDNKK